ncbi:MAG: tRNA (guanosine(37)-N1)-methyltransferase TrmD [Alphaproteobacteria bacterium]|nr:tRNA (guanosine(37)-N1)-methyltransferase TrmD [Alphaproteobacteria bacterium]
MPDPKTPLFSAICLTLFPEMFPATLGHSLAGKALEKGIWSLQAIDIREFSTDKHRTVDASPYGGGTGMVLRPDVVDAAVEHALSILSPWERSGASQGEGCPQSQISPHPNPLPEGEGKRPIIFYTSPRGEPITQKLAEEIKNQQVIIVCGRFEGLDQRAIDHHQMREISLGDFVLSGGEIAALALIDAAVRLLPGVISKESATDEESFACHTDYAGLLEYPHYTRPPVWKGMEVPEVLLSGNHEHINKWRLEQAKMITKARRPDLVKKT